MYIVGLVKEEICSYKKKSNLEYQVKKWPFLYPFPWKKQKKELNQSTCTAVEKMAFSILCHLD